MDFKHSFIDKSKPGSATDIFPADISGNGTPDVVCGRWWYKSPAWERFEIPAIFQAIQAHDIDSDGKEEIVAIEGETWSSNLVWLKPIDPERGKWEKHPIGSGIGDWPHGSLIAPVLNGKSVLLTAYHSAYKQKDHFPEMFEIPEDPKQHPWKKSRLTDVLYAEEIKACDITGDGSLNIVLGSHWLEYSNGKFIAHHFAPDFNAIRVCTADVNGNGRPDIILAEMEQEIGKNMSRLAWFENPENPRECPWKMHMIEPDLMYPHSLDAADIDGDGEEEIVCGEHCVSNLYKTGCRTLVFKKDDKEGTAWKKTIVDDRFEHHCGTKFIKLEKDKTGIISHGWCEKEFVNLWETA